MFSCFSLSLLFGLLFFGYFFYTTGGMALVRIVQNYLIPNIQNKEYSWLDFMDQGPEKNISGFYAMGDINSFSIWTLSGLKTYKPPASGGQYLYSAICESINSNNKSDNSLSIQELKLYDYDIWRSYMKKEYFVTIKRNIENPNNIDVIWSMSGKYKRPKVIGLDTCQ
jgi:hypothetical protein